MLKIGKFNRLKISQFNGSDIYVDGEDQGDILLSPAATSIQPKQLGECVDVFIYNGKKGDLLATTITPLAQVGEVAWLKVADVNNAGAFLDWGLPKDLRVSFHEQQEKMQIGNHYLVKLFLDEDNQITASSYLNDFIQDQAVYLQEGQSVDLIIAERTDLGVKAIVNHQFWGMLYNNDIFQSLSKGQAIRGYIKKIRSDKKIDLTLNQVNDAQKINELGSKILEQLREHGGSLPLSDHSSPAEIYQSFGVSKKIFKQTLGHLYKKRLITITKNTIKLTK